ncbi:MAG: crosslink repair DNA glycosylase YcaQ family protein [Thermomicrobiales bacterium]
MERLSLAEARSLAVIAQRLDRRPRGSSNPRTTKRRLLEIIRAIGCVQLDTISVISRSHETVLWSRLGAYDRRLLAALQFPDGALMEYWAHAAALAPIEDFPYYRRTMEHYRRDDELTGSWATENTGTMDRVMAAARSGGEVSSRTFARAEGPRPGPWVWWGGKSERRALDHLWSQGRLAVVRREGFERVYSPTDLVVPASLREYQPTLEEEREYFAKKALAALGVTTAAWMSDYFRAGSRSQLTRREAAMQLDRLAASGDAMPVAVEGWSGLVFMDSGLQSRLAELRRLRGRPSLTTLLSPFDNLVWHRGRTAALFGFEYRLESYTPAARRVYGYYTLPILRRGRLIGRLDPSYDRRARRLTVRALHFERWVEVDEGVRADITSALVDLATFLGATTVHGSLQTPPWCRADLTVEVETGSDSLPTDER